MASVVVPFRNRDPKRRLEPLGEAARDRLAAAMLADVLQAARSVGDVIVVVLEPLEDAPRGVRVVPDPRRGQGAAVQAGLDSAVEHGLSAPFLVCNADLPCATPRDLLALAGAVPEAGSRPGCRERRYDQRARTVGGPGVRGRLRPRERGPLRGAGAVADARGAESRRRRRHARRPRARLVAARPADAPAVPVARARESSVNVAVLSGGVGGARFLRGLLDVVDPVNVSIVGNVADDIEILGLHVSPDLDSILYTLAGLGRRRARLGTCGRDLERARGGRLARRRVVVLARRPRSRPAPRAYAAPPRGAAPLRRDGTDRHAVGLEAALLPATDDPVRTFVETPAGTFPFQTWFVARGHRDEVDAVHYAGAPRSGRRARA